MEPMAPSPEPGRPPTVLVVDDDPSVLEMARRLRASAATRAIPVVVMTGSADVTEMMAAGCVG